MNNTKRIMPIRFWKLEVGSTFTIFAEPSRGVTKSPDTALYFKNAESYSTAVNEDPERAIILYPEDLVVPRSRPARQ